MKPRCPIPKCGRDISTSNGVLCETHWQLVPRPLVNEIVQAKAIIKNTRSAPVMRVAFRAEGEAKRRAIQHVIDKQNEKVPA